MRTRIFLAFIGLFYSCTQHQVVRDVRVNANEIKGYWENDQQLIAVWDSIMLHPVHKISGFFAFSINQDSLIINDGTLNGTLAELLKLDSDSLIFLCKDSTFRYSRARPINPDINFESISFKAGPCHGDCIVFELKIGGDGKVEYKANPYSGSEANLYGQLPLPLLQELNNFFGYIDFQSYHETGENKLFPIAGSPDFDLVIRFEDEKGFDVDNGVFAGKFGVLPKLFYKFNEIVELKDET